MSEPCEKCNGRWGNEKESPHPCPYQEDMNSNYDEDYCTCCYECTQQCAADI